MKVTKFRKKPVVVEALQWTDSDIRTMYNFLEGKTDNDPICREGKNFYIDHDKAFGGLIIQTLEGDHIAEIGDWIIKGVEGEFYPCKPSVFELTYELADDS